MLGELITNSLVLILGYAYPAFECFKTIEKHGAANAELRFWCQYWVVIAVLTVFERIGDIFISWVPMYGEMKLALIIYLWYPKTKGTGYVYNAMLRPFVARHETDIERSFKELRAKAWDVAIYYWNNSSELGQTRFFDILHNLTSRPSRPRSEASRNHQNPGEGRPPPPPTIAPTLGPQPDQAEDRWAPNAPPLSDVSHRRPIYPEEELRVTGSPRRPAYPDELRIPGSPRRPTNPEELRIPGSPRRPTNPEELRIPGSPSRPGLIPGQREPVWLRFKRSRGL